ncbi:MAG: CBS domain-containing protein [Flavobacteriales bacterium]
MQAKELISYDIPSLKPEDSGDTTLAMMDEYRVSHIALVKDGEYLGLISDNDIYNFFEDTGEEIKIQKLSLMRPFVKVQNHVLEVVKIMGEARISVIPVLDDKETYIGSILSQDVAYAMSKLISANEPGGVIVLEVNVNDYSLSHIAQIVESDGGKILSCSTSTPNESTKLEVVLKINKIDLSRIIQTFDRFKYNIKESYHQSTFDEDLQRRYDLFMNYLNM